MNLRFILQNFEDIVASIFISITTVLVIINIILR